MILFFTAGGQPKKGSLENFMSVEAEKQQVLSFTGAWRLLNQSSHPKKTTFS